MVFAQLFKKASYLISDFRTYLVRAVDRSEIASHLVARTSLDNAKKVIDEVGAQQDKFDEDDKNRYFIVMTDFRKAKSEADNRKRYNLKKCLESTLTDYKKGIWRAEINNLYHANGSVTSPGITEEDVVKGSRDYAIKVGNIDINGECAKLIADANRMVSSYYSEKTAA